MSEEIAVKQELSARTSARLPSGADEYDGGESAVSYLDRPNYVPGYLIRLANAMSRGGSRVYLKLYGVGVNEWQMLSMLAIDPGLLAKQICDALELDKAAASRSVKSLLELGLVRSEPSGPNQRSRCLFLTAQGLALHDRILVLAIERERYLLAGISEAERETMLSLLTRLTENLDALSAFEDRLVADAALPRDVDVESDN